MASEAELGGKVSFVVELGGGVTSKVELAGITASTPESEGGSMTDIPSDRKWNRIWNRRPDSRLLVDS